MTNSNMVLELYSCPGRPEKWQGAMDSLCSATGGRSAVIQRFRKTAGGLQQLWAARDSYSTCHADMHDQLVNNARNPRYDLRMAEPAMVNRIIRDKDRFPNLHQDEIRQFTRRLKLARLGSSIGVVRPLSEDEAIGVIVHRSVDDRRAFSGQQEQVLLELIPHLGQAADLAWQMEESARQVARHRAIADRLEAGLVQLDGQGRIDWANDAALEAIAACDALCIAGSRLVGTGTRDRARMSELIAGNPDDDAAIAVFSAGERHEVQIMRLARPDDTGGPALILATPRKTAGASIDAIGQMLQVTRAEARVSRAVLEGATVKSYASERGISEGSARNQLKQVFAKSGIGRQSELVSYLSNSVTRRIRSDR